MKAGALIVAALVVFSATAIAGGDTKRQGAPEDSWTGDSNTDDKQRSLLIKCPEDTAAETVEVLPDDEGAVIVVECNYQ